MNELALFAGAGGGILGGKILGWRTVCAVEREPYPISVLISRQNDGFLPPFPIWDDINTFDGKPWRGLVDVVSGGFPCQDISSAGKGVGIEGERSSLWYEMLRVIKEVRPKYCFIENSPHLRTKGLVTILQGLAEAGYDAGWDVISAEDCGANHRRKRMWIVAADSNLCGESVSEINAETSGLQESLSLHKRTLSSISNSWWGSPPDVYRMDDGVAFGMDRIKAIGNGQVPIVAATAWKKILNEIQSVCVLDTGETCDKTT